MDLNLVQLVFEVESVKSEAHFASLFYGLRRFNTMFRQSCCCYENNPCLTCTEKAACPYQIIFAQELSTDPDVVRRHQKPPLPFAFKIRQITDNNSSFELTLVLAGSAVNHLSVFLDAVQLLIESVSEPYSQSVPVITGLYCLDYQSARHELNISSHDTQNLIVLSSLEIMENTARAENIRLTLQSPLRLINSGSVLHSFDFTAFLRSQLRRCSSLFAYYGDGELDIDYAGLSYAADQVIFYKDCIRYSYPLWSQRLNHAGLLGNSEFRILVPGMLPLLALGSYFNAGKGASFGFGAYMAEAV